MKVVVEREDGREAVAKQRFNGRLRDVNACIVSRNVTDKYKGLETTQREASEITKCDASKLLVWRK